MDIVNGMDINVRIKNVNFCHNSNVMEHILILGVAGIWILVMVINIANKFPIYLIHK